MRPLTIDFETYYSPEFTLSKFTTEAYVRDPRFEVIGVGFLDEETGESGWLEDGEFWAWSRGIDWSQVDLLAHHAHFDGLILNHHYGIRPGRWRCTLSMARAAHGYDAGGSLEKLATRFGFPPKGTEVLQAKGKRRRDFTPEEWAKYGEYCVHDCEIAAGVFQKLEPEFPEAELTVVDHVVRMFTEPVLHVNAPLLEQFVADEETRKEALLARVCRERLELNSNPRFAAILESFGIDPPKKISPTTGEETFAFAKSDPGMQDLLEHDHDEVRWLAEARVAIKSTINETRSRRLLESGRRGPGVPVYLKYSGAHTHRLSGGDKMNFQNFARGGVIRDAIIAPPGCVIVVVDSGQIEARGTAWLAGQDDLTQAFADGQEIYCDFASLVYHREIKKDDPERNVGKVSILGLGYCMGWKKFADTLLRGPMGMPPIQFTRQDAENMGINTEKFIAHHAADIAGIKSRLEFDALAVHCAVAHRVVGEYRTRYYSIKRLWGDMEDLLVEMSLDNPASVFRDVLIPERHALMLPSGLRLKYAGLQQEDNGEWSYLGGRMRTERTKIYGGLVTENVIQALARQVMVEQWLAVYEETGYRPVMSTHDELAYVVPIADGEAMLELVKQKMAVSPAWCPGWPLKASGGIGECYGEAK